MLQSSGGVSGQRPLPLTASSPALVPPSPAPALPPRGRRWGCGQGAGIKSPELVPGSRSAPCPPPPAGPGRGCSAAPRWWPGSLRSSVLANFPGSVPACRGRSESPSPPGLVL